MKTHPLQTPSNSHPRAFFSVYDDLASGKRAKETCDYIRGQFGPESTIHGDFWKLDVLREPALRQLATPLARAADIIIFSTNSDKHLPLEIKTWLEGCLSHETERLRLLLSVFPRPPSACANTALIEAHLQQVAARKNVAFLSRIIEVETGRAAGPKKTDSSDRRLRLATGIECSSGR